MSFPCLLPSPFLAMKNHPWILRFPFPFSPHLGVPYTNKRKCIPPSAPLLAPFLCCVERDKNPTSSFRELLHVRLLVECPFFFFSPFSSPGELPAEPRRWEWKKRFLSLQDEIVTKVNTGDSYPPPPLSPLFLEFAICLVRELSFARLAREGRFEPFLSPLFSDLCFPGFRRSWGRILRTVPP